MVTKLVVASGKSAGRSISIKRNKLLIGRAEECDVRPLSEEVSRRHCAVIVGPADVWVEDLGSRNGTLVNGTRIEAKTKLVDGDMIRVGSLELRVSCQNPAAKGGEGDVSHWLMQDEPSASTSDTTRSVAASKPEADESAESSFVGGIEGSPTESPEDSSSDASGRSSATISLEELKAASKSKPGTLPQVASKKADSSRDAAAEALKKFFDRK
jgi:predicted component of type VI protein secretion system